MQRFVQTAVQNGVATTPALNAMRLLLDYANYSSTVVPRSSIWGCLMPNYYRDILWRPTSIFSRRLNLTSHLAQLDNALEQKKLLVKMLYDGGAALYLGTGTFYDRTL